MVFCDWLIPTSSPQFLSTTEEQSIIQVCYNLFTHLCMNGYLGSFDPLLSGIMQWAFLCTRTWCIRWYLYRSRLAEQCDNSKFNHLQKCEKYIQLTRNTKLTAGRILAIETCVSGCRGHTSLFFHCHWQPNSRHDPPSVGPCLLTICSIWTQ